MLIYENRKPDVTDVKLNDREYVSMTIKESAVWPKKLKE